MLKPDERYSNLKILSLSEEADAKRLLLLLSGKDFPDTDVGLSNLSAQPNLPGGAIANLVLPDSPRSIGAQTAIVESEYVDRDSNAAYSQLYARAFRDYLRRTYRLHFFGARLSSYDELLNGKSLENSYLGYCVLPQTQPRTIGRTVLPPPKGDPCWLFIPTQSEFPANLAGLQLKATGTAYAQQDGRVAACASAAVWMSSVMLSGKFGYDMPVHSMAEITQLATKYSLPPRGFGSQPGLTIGQMLWALYEMGYEPFAHDVRDPDEAMDLIYNCVESGIPPILVIKLPNEDEGYHAITAVGHTYGINPDQEKLNRGMNSASAWCPYFLAHDDQKGLYIKMKLGPPTLQTDERLSILVDDNDPLIASYNRDNFIRWYQNASLWSVIAPFPPRHVLRVEEARNKGKDIIEIAYNLYEKLKLKIPEYPIYRTYFTTSNDFKQRFISAATPTSDKHFRQVTSELAHLFRGSLYPRYIWVTELCGLEHRNSRRPEELKIVAEVVIDPTSHPHTSDFVVLHLPHLFFKMSPSDMDVNDALGKPIHIERDGEYKPLVRLDMSQGGA